MKSLLVSTGIDSDCVIELDWWDSSEFPVATHTGGAKVSFTCTPTQHNSGRGLADQGATLWASWAVKQTWSEPVSNTQANELKDRVASVWHAGDTGYQSSNGPCPVFKGPLVPPSLLSYSETQN